MSQKIIYLDQHVWINLAQAYFGKNKDMYTLCEKVIKASESECAICYHCSAGSGSEVIYGKNGSTNPK